MLQNYFLVGAVFIALVGGASDWRSARIPNRLTYCAMAGALLLRLPLLGWSGFSSGVLGMFVAGGFLLLLFAIGAMGGGDVKLMAAVGAWMGKEYVVSVLLTSVLAGGLLAIIYIVFHQGLRKTLANIIALICFHLTSGLQPHPVLNIHENSTLRVPFGVAIAMGTLCCAANALWWR
jgi:prepilin peptidase CpaA